MTSSLRTTGLVVMVLSAAAGCEGRKIERAQADAQVIASAMAYARARKVDYCPGVDLLRSNGDLSDGVATRDPWGTAFAIACKSMLVTVTSAGPDKTQATTDDVHATAVSTPASTTTVPYSPYSDRPGPPPVAAPSPANAGGSVSDVGKLGRPGQTGRTFLFESRADYDESFTLVAAKDLDGYKALVRSSSMPCEPGTRVRILETTWTGGRRVRILDGAFAGKSGWVAKEEIQPE